MKYLIRSTSAFLLFVICLPLQADIREVFVCNYNDGKGIQDVMDARDFYVSQSKKAGLDVPQAFIWTPWKSFSDIDLLWFNVHEDFAAFAKQADAGAGSAEMAAVTEKFDSVADCNSGLMSREVVFDGGKFEIENPPAIIGSNACMLKKGMRADDLTQLWSHARTVLGSMKEYENHIVFATTPLTPGPATPDIFVYSVHESATAMATKQAALMKTEGGRLLASHFNSLLDCNNSFWIGQSAIDQ
jgi:hypothetical protein